MERRQRPSRAPQRRRDLHEAARVAARVGVRLGREHRSALRSPSSPPRPAGRCCRCRRCRSRCPARAGSSSSRPGIAREHRRAARSAMPCACLRWHESWNATRSGSGCRSARAGASASSSETSTTFARAVVLQMRAAAGGVRDDRVVAASSASLELPCARDAFVEPPGVRVQRAAAALRARDVHVVAVGGEHARGRRVDVAEDDALHAACDDARRAGRRPGRCSGGHSGAEPRRRDLPRAARAARARAAARNASAARSRRRCGKTAKISAPQRAARRGPRRWCSST